MSLPVCQLNRIQVLCCTLATLRVLPKSNKNQLDGLKSALISVFLEHLTYLNVLTPEDSQDHASHQTAPQTPSLESIA